MNVFLLLGIILLVIGVLLMLIPPRHPNAPQLGWALIVIGIILIVVGILVGSDINLNGDGDKNGMLLGLPTLLLSRLVRRRRPVTLGPLPTERDGMLDWNRSP